MTIDSCDVTSNYYTYLLVAQIIACLCVYIIVVFVSFVYVFFNFVLVTLLECY